jgi:hypothetical protein
MSSIEDKLHTEDFSRVGRRYFQSEKVTLALLKGYAPYFNRTFAYEIYYYGIYFYKICFYGFILLQTVYTSP